MLAHVLVSGCIYNSVSDIWEAGRSSRAFAELAGRTHVMLSDVVMALIEMGKSARTS